MALVVKDRVKEVTTTTGTSNLTLGGAVYGFQSFSVIGNGNTTYYGIYDSATGDWEVGVGTYSTTGPTLTRDTVLESSNSGSKVVFGAGSKDVFVTYPAERSVYLDAAGSAVTVLDVGTLGVSTANISTANITAGTISTTPTSSNDLVNKTYVDAIAAQGISYHTPVKYEVPDTTGNLNATYNNGASGVGATLTNAGTQAPFAPDGPTAQVGDRILIYNQTNAAQNGVYQVTVVGTASTNWVLTRTSDANTYGVKDPNALGAGDAFYVTSGNTGAGETYVCNTAGTITFGTTAITFAQISSAQVYSAGAGLTLSNLVFSITPVGTASTYGSSSSVPVFTTNAYGQVTSVTNTGIAISAGAVSGLAPSATTDTTNASNITSGTLGSARLTGSYTGITGVGTLTAGTWNASTIGAAYGGTGITSYTVGDILYADGSTSLAKLADVATGNALLSGGVGTAPAWGKIGLQTHVSGTLQVTNGGTGATTASGARTNLGLVIGTDVPSPTGTGASGTWGINISGNAATATTATTSTTATQVSNSVTFNNSGTGAASGNGFNGSSALTVSYNTIGAPSTTGTNASGTWSISISGNAATASNASQLGGKPPQDAPGANTIPTRDGSGYVYFNYINSNTGNSENPTVSQVIVTNGSDNFYRKASVAHLTSSLSGTAPINITGSAGSSTTSTYATYISNISLGSGSVNVNYAASAVLRTESGSGAALAYAPVLHVAAGDTMWQAQGTYGSSGDGTLYFRQGYNGSWGNWQTMLSSYNYSSYALPLSGGVMTGTISGGSGVTSLVIGNYAGALRGYLYNDTSGFGLLTSSGGWAVRVDYGTSSVYIPGIGYSASSLRAPIFYDTDNTAYYVDPTSSTSANFYGSVNAATYNLAGLLVNASGTASTGGSIAIQQVTAEGWTGIFCDFEPYTGWGLWHDNPNNYFSFTAEASTGGIRSFSVPSRVSGNRTAYEKFRVDQATGDTITGRDGYAQSSFRAPIFYDSNDTNYYVDPNSNSRLVNLGLGGVTPDVRLSVSGDGHISSYLYLGGTAGSAGSWSARMYSSGGATYINTNTFEVNRVGYGGSAVFSTDTSGNTFSATSSRAPIFYDSNDTGYYIDPNSTSDTALRMRGGALFGPNQTWGAYLYVGTNGNISGTATVATTNGNLHLDPASGSSTYLNYYAGSNVYFGNGASGGVYAQIANDGSFRSPIYYDYNNTAYYCDPAGFSNMGSLTLNGSAYFYPNNWIGLGGDYGIYNYSAGGNGAHFLANQTSSYGAWRMIGSRNTYGGIYDTYSAVNGIMYDGGGNGGVYREANGRWYFYYALSNDCMGIGTSSTSSTYSLYLTKGVYAQSRIDATIFYDTNNTGYYVDPASSSQFSLIYADNWFRAQGETGLYSSSYGQHIYAKSGGAYWGVTAAGNGNGGLIFYQSYESSLRGYVYWDGSGFGLLHSSGGWAVRTTPSVVELYNSVYAPIIYDSNNSGYYVDPNSNSRLNQVLADGGTFYGATYFQSNQNTTGSSPPLQAYSNNGSGAIMAFHRGGYYAVNMGLDSDNVIRIGGWSAAANRLQMDMSGNLTMAGSVTAFSDERLKKDWADLSDDFIERLASVKAGTYTRIDSGERQAGSSAQDWQELLPEVVSEDAAGTLALAYGNAAVVACVELAKSVVALRAEIKALRAQ